MAALYNTPLSISFLLLFPLILLLCTQYFFVRRKHAAINLPPTPGISIPLIGHLHLLRSIPHISLCRLSRKHGPLIRLNLGQFITIVASSRETAAEILKTQDTHFYSRPFPSKVQSFRSIREQEVEAMVNAISIQSASLVNLSDVFTCLFNNIMFREVFGKRPTAAGGDGEYSGTMRSRYHELIAEVIFLMGVFFLGDLFPSLGWVDVIRGWKGKLDRSFRALDAVLEEEIAEGLKRRERQLEAMPSEEEDDFCFLDVLLRHLTNDDQNENNGPVGLQLNRVEAKSLLMFRFQKVGTKSIWNSSRDGAPCLLRSGYYRDWSFGQCSVPMATFNGRQDLAGIKILRAALFGGGHQWVDDIIWRASPASKRDSPASVHYHSYIDIFIGGTDTAASVLEWAMANLMRNPEVMRRAQEEVRQVVEHKGSVKEGDLHELHYLKMVIKETLRLHPPGPLLVHRECMKETTIEGYRIPVKARILVNAWAIGRDPKYWDDPESFKPERFEGSAINYLGNHLQFIPFGAGRRICPGMGLGIIGVELALANFIYNFNWEMPAGMRRENVSLEEDFGLISHRKEPLLLVPIIA
ncbi:Cytochrome P450 71A1 [Platanthera zijinensis]|uniref:Cytochrome P450 71A1 n=1 Tax=Platanthera zijinensis TaxID=2320716 RepID=A0AAP0BV23_9ASPA